MSTRENLHTATPFLVPLGLRHKAAGVPCSEDARLFPKSLVVACRRQKEGSILVTPLISDDYHGISQKQILVLAET